MSEQGPKSKKQGTKLGIGTKGIRKDLDPPLSCLWHVVWTITDWNRARSVFERGLNDDPQSRRRKKRLFGGRTMMAKRYQRLSSIGLFYESEAPFLNRCRGCPLHSQIKVYIPLFGRNMALNIPFPQFLAKL